MQTRINFNNAKQDHKDWVARVRAFLDGKENLEQKDIDSHTTCGLGTWFYAEGKENYGHIEAIQEFELKHKKLHKIAADIYDLKKAKDLKMAEEFFLDLKATSESVVALLTSAEEVINEGLEEQQAIEDNYDVAVAWDKSLKLVMQTDASGNILYVNENFADVSGYNDIDFIGQPFTLCHHEIMPKVITKLFLEGIKESINRRTFIKYKAKSGKYFWVLANYKINTKPNGTIDTIYSTQIGLSSDLIENYVKPLYLKLKSIEDNFDVAASERYLNGFLKERNRDYDEFVLNLKVTGQDSIKTNKKWSLGGFFKSFKS